MRPPAPTDAPGPSEPTVRVTPGRLAATHGPEKHPLSRLHRTVYVAVGAIAVASILLALAPNPFL